VLGNINGSRELFSLLDKLGIEICVSQVDEHSRWDLLVKDLPADFVKMSPSFIRRLGEGDGLEKEFLDASTPARERGVKVIMPMVEDANMAANLWHVGADYMQGFMIQEAQERIDLSD
ncbi:MAG TPA: EAL domain-containing protein, partial [Wenzhouxiangella sp.]|nr:EAL domain-containing protein [Wenzhouxiangella sp.]